MIRTTDRDELQAHLKKNGVGTEVYYPVPLHLQECFAYLGHSAGAFPESERAAKETLALPVHPELTEEQTQFVVDSILEFFEGRAGAAALGEAVPALAGAGSHAERG